MRYAHLAVVVAVSGLLTNCIPPVIDFPDGGTAGGSETE